jgi:hypothetical protein
MDGETFSRRRVTVGALVAAGCWGFGSALLSRRCAPGGAESSYDALAALCASLRCPSSLAEACLRSLPTDERNGLAASLLVDIPSFGGGKLAVANLHYSIRQQSRDDFCARRIVVVDGWMLSATEVRLYAMSAVLRGEAIDE